MNTSYVLFEEREIAATFVKILHKFMRTRRLKVSSEEHMCRKRSARIALLVCKVWHAMQFKIKFKILVITFKAIHGLAPEYIIDLIGIKRALRYSLRSNNELLLELPRERTKRTLEDRAFCAAPPELWNSLPIKIRNSRTLNNFKKTLKTLLFRLSFVPMF